MLPEFGTRPHVHQAGEQAPDPANEKAESSIKVYQRVRVSASSPDVLQGRLDFPLSLDDATGLSDGY